MLQEEILAEACNAITDENVVLTNQTWEEALPNWRHYGAPLENVRQIQTMCTTSLFGLVYVYILLYVLEVLD
jgi:ABC-type uncharacterized transport system YnjBCD substrate-binding protein